MALCMGTIVNFSIQKKRDLRKCNNYKTISLISHPRKIMLRIILNRLNPTAENILAEEKADFKKKRITIELMLNCRIMTEKHIEHRRKLYHNCVHFKKAFDKARHEGLWKVMRHFNIDEHIIAIFENI